MWCRDHLRSFYYNCSAFLVYVDFTFSKVLLKTIFGHTAVIINILWKSGHSTKDQRITLLRSLQKCKRYVVARQRSGITFTKCKATLRCDYKTRTCSLRCSAFNNSIDSIEHSNWNTNTGIHKNISEIVWSASCFVIERATVITCTEFFLFYKKLCLTKGTIVVFILIRCGFTIGFSLALLIPSMRSLRPTIRSNVKINTKIIAVETQIMRLGKESPKKKKPSMFYSYITTITDKSSWHTCLKRVLLSNI